MIHILLGVVVHLQVTMCTGAVPREGIHEVRYNFVGASTILDGLLGITFRFLRREVSTDVFAFLQNSILEQA